MPLAEGSRIGPNLRLRSELGSGAMGKVWVADNEVLGSQVAVKVLHATKHDRVAAEKRFVQEARAVAQLDSPHVVRIFDFGISEEGEPYIVMELLRGRDLMSYIREQGAMAPKDVGVILRQICRGLRRAHELDIVHRDIKPANVFIVEVDGEPFVKVLDFGIAKYGDGQELGLTETGALMGTPYYMSPEQFISPKDIDGRSDLWSVAVVTYACLVGKLPFLGETVGALSIAVHKGEFVPPTEIVRELPSQLDAFFEKALAVSPDARFADADELAAAYLAAIDAPPAARVSISISKKPVTEDTLDATTAPRSRVDEYGDTEMMTTSRRAAEVMDATASPHATDLQAVPRDRRWIGLLAAAAALFVAYLWLRNPAPAPTPAAPESSEQAIATTSDATTSEVAIAPDPEPSALPPPIASASSAARPPLTTARPKSSAASAASVAASAPPAASSPQPTGPAAREGWP